MKGHPFAHVSRAIAMQPLKIGWGIRGQLKGLQIRFSGPRHVGVLVFKEIRRHSSIQQFARA